FELDIPALAALGPRTIADVVLRYTTLGAEVAQHAVTIPLTVNLVSADEAAAGGANPQVTEEIVILRSANAQREAREQADRGDFDTARTILSDAARELRTIAPTSAKADELVAQADQLEEHSTFMASATYDAIRRKKMLYQERYLSRERSRDEQRKRREPPKDPA